MTVAGALLLFAIGTELALGWSTNTMRSGSMAPAIRRGDVLMSIPAPRGRMLGTGTVVVFSGSDQRTTAHRIVGHTPDGDYVTRGDANPVDDSDRLSPAHVRGVGRLLVPYVGLPYVWWRERRFTDIALLAAVLLACAWLTRYASAPRVKNAGATA